MYSVKGLVSGRVQGVGFRYFVKRCADKENLRGYVYNLFDGRVEFFLQGNQDAVDLVLEQLKIGPHYSQVTGLMFEQAEPDHTRQGFDIQR